MSRSWRYLSHVLSDTSPMYGNREGFKTEPTGQWRTPNHIGTHVDAPCHFVDGAKSIEALPPDFWHFISPLLFECPMEADELLGVEKLSRVRGSLESRQPDALLIRTGFEKFRGSADYWESNPGFSEEAAQWIKRELPSVRLVGLDTISVNAWKHREEGRRAHRALLAAPDLVIVEDMNLSGVSAEIMELWVAPLRVLGADGAPCTVWGGF